MFYLSRIFWFCLLLDALPMPLTSLDEPQPHSAVITRASAITAQIILLVFFIILYPFIKLSNSHSNTIFSINQAFIDTA